MQRIGFSIAAAVAGLLISGTAATAGPFMFNGHADYGDGGPYYYVITGNSAKVPKQTRNGDNATGGTFRFVTDAPDWGYPTDAWQKDDWFPQNAGLALTLKNGGSPVYDNNGIDAGTYGSFYSADNGNPTPGLYRGFSMVNDWDWIYASYFELTKETTFDTIVGYFDLNSDSGLADFLTDHGFIMNLWSETTDDSLLPVNTDSFVGDVFSSVSTPGTFVASDTDVDRVLPDGSHDDIYRLEYHLASPMTLGSGGYYFSHAAYITPEPSSFALLATGLIGFGGFVRRRRVRKSG